MILNTMVNLFDTTLAAPLNHGDTTMTLPTGKTSLLGATGVLTLTASTSVADLRNSERVHFTAIAGNDLTIEREYDGSTQPVGAWPAGTKVLMLVNAVHFQEIHNYMYMIEDVLANAFGGGDGVIHNTTTYDYKVAAKASPDMTVRVYSGTCWVSRKIVKIDTTTNLAAISAPSTHPRIDVVQISNVGTISIKTGSEGASPSAPLVDTNNLKLAEIYCRVGMSSIKDTDDSTNGYITDARTYV